MESLLHFSAIVHTYNDVQIVTGIIELEWETRSLLVAGVKVTLCIYQPGRENTRADPSPEHHPLDVQVAGVW